MIRKRADFLAANRGKRFVTPSFVLLAHRRRPDHSIETDRIRYGITVTKKIGNAVARNRMKRRFRALLAQCLPDEGIAGVDHIMIGRKTVQEADFATMKADLEKGLKYLAKSWTKNVEVCFHLLRAMLAMGPVANPASDMSFSAHLQCLYDRGD
ncbi:ribonuclease P protein component [Sphingopyxis sp. BSNA05]|uniref:ribonuclease P protein component n=1 Tax=Sphingopyxis sp. BSNA05 TaxID=1236614 RepID=UPI00349F7543